MRIRTYHSHMQPIGILVPVRVWSLHIHPESKRPVGARGVMPGLFACLCAHLCLPASLLYAGPHRFIGSRLHGGPCFFCCAVLWNAVLRDGNGCFIYGYLRNPFARQLPSALEHTECSDSSLRKQSCVRPGQQWKL